MREAPRASVRSIAIARRMSTIVFPSTGGVSFLLLYPDEKKLSIPSDSIENDQAGDRTPTCRFDGSGSLSYPLTLWAVSCSRVDAVPHTLHTGLHHQALVAAVPDSPADRAKPWM